MRIPVPDEILPAADLGRVHFVGIGGAALSGIARIMARQGVAVTGSDDHDTPFLPSLREIGVPCHLSYDAEHVGDADTVVVTTAARDDNPEVLEARARGLRILPRSAGLKSVMAGRRVLAVAGTHGKTTTTSLLTMAVRACGADPTYAIGGVLAATGRNADAGSGDLFVAEADESDGAFLVYRPHAALVTNVDADHLDVWGSEEAYRAAFSEFVGTIDAGRRPRALHRRSRGRRPRATSPGSRAAGGDRRARRRLRRPRDRPRLRWLAVDLRGQRRRSGTGSRDAPGARTPLRARRARRPRAGPAARPALRRPPRRARGVHRHRPPDGAQGRGRGSAGLRLLRPPPGRDRRRPAGGACPCR